MAFASDYYDFQCGNDTRFVKVAVKSNIFHTITIEADIAKTIDFSGGTRDVEVIRLNKCFKASRIIWPERTSSIKRLFICNAETMTHMDVTALTNLEELSIINCDALEVITGLPSTLKELNAHHVKIKTLDFHDAKQLQKLNLITDAADVNLDLSGKSNLQMLYLKTCKKSSEERKGVNLHLNGCGRLHTLFIDSGDNPANLDITACNGITDICVLCGKDSSVKGLTDCKNMKFYHVCNRMTLDEPTKLYVEKIKKIQAASLDITKQDKKLEDIKKHNTEYYGPTQTTAPGLYDRETIIHESGSRKEHGLSRAVKIILLSMPIEFHNERNANSMIAASQTIRYDDTAFSSPLKSHLYYLPETSYIPVPAIDLRNARILTTNTPPWKTITAFLKNTDHRTPNNLVLTPQDITKPDVAALLQQCEKQTDHVTFGNEKYTLRASDRIVFTGDWYAIKNTMPSLASVTTMVNPAALAPPNANSLILTDNEENHYMQLLQDSNTRLNQNLSAKQQHNLSQELHRTSHEFFDSLNSMIQSQPQPSASEQSDPGNAAVISNRDWTPQHEVHGERHYPPVDNQRLIDAGAETRPVDGQDLIDAQAGNREMPDDGSQPVDAGAQHRQPSFDDQQPLDGETRAREMPHDDQQLVDGRAQAQEPLFNDQSLINGKAQRRNTPYDDQHLIDAQAGKQEPDFNDQHLIDAQAGKQEPDFNDQHLIDAQAGKQEPDFIDQHLVDAQAKKQEPDFTDQYPIDARAEHREKPYDDQHLIDASAHHQLDSTLPLNPEEIQQMLLDKSGKKTEPLKDAEPLNPDEALDQQLLSANMKKSVSVSPPLTVDHTNRQFLFSADKVSREEIQVPEAGDAPLLSMPETRLLGAARNLAHAMKKMAGSLPAEPVIRLKKLETELKRVNHKESLIAATSQVITTIKDLHDVIKHDTVQSKAASKPAAKMTEDDVARRDLINHLYAALQHRTQPDLMHQTAYSTGVASARMKLIKHFIDALQNRKKLDASHVNMGLAELRKDPGISAQLRNIEPQLIKALTEAPAATKTSKPTDE